MDESEDKAVSICEVRGAMKPLKAMLVERRTRQEVLHMEILDAVPDAIHTLKVTMGYVNNIEHPALVRSAKDAAKVIMQMAFPASERGEGEDATSAADKMLKLGF